MGPSNSSTSLTSSSALGDGSLTLTPLAASGGAEGNEDMISPPTGNTVTELEPAPANMHSGSSNGMGQLLQCNGSTYYVPNNEPSLLASFNGLRAGSPGPLSIGLSTGFQTGSSTQSQSMSNSLVAHLHQYEAGSQKSSSGGNGMSSSANLAAQSSEVSSMVQPYTTRVSPLTISWLVNNYETAEGVSLPRSALYSHYQKHCQETKQEPVNAASFGKLIRSVFLGLRTRRIGTRGNSKYHYYGIRVKATSNLVIADEDRINFATASMSAPLTKKKASSVQEGKTPSSSSSNNNEVAQPPKLTLAPHLQLPSHIKQYLGNPSPSIENFPHLKVPKDIKLSSQEVLESTTQDFHLAYHQHCKQIQEAIYNMKFNL